jgi:hypothetical protein
MDKDVEINCLEEVRKIMEEALDGWQNGVGPVKNVWHMEISARQNFWNIVRLKARKVSFTHISSSVFLFLFFKIIFDKIKNDTPANRHRFS